MFFYYLNIEGGQIERPLKPMLRFGTPVFDINGYKKGERGLISILTGVSMVFLLSGIGFLAHAADQSVGGGGGGSIR